MNSHEEIRRNLPAYCSGDLSPAEQAQIRDHLASCPACRGEVTELETVMRLLRTTPQVEPPPWLATRVMARVREQGSPRSSWLRRLFIPMRVKLPLEAAALLVVCLTGWYLTRSVETELKQQPHRSDTFEQAAPSQPVETEQPATGGGIHPPPAPPSFQPQQKPHRTPESADQPALQAHPPAPTSPRSDAAPEHPAGFAPSPAIRKEEKSAPAAGAPAAPLRSAPTEESAGRLKDLAPERARKAFKGTLRNEAESPAPSPTGSTMGKQAAEPNPAGTIRLALDNPDTPPDRVREAVTRSGGTITSDRSQPPRSFRIRIAADRLPELLRRLELLGRITERTVPQADSRQIEVTVTW